MTSATKKYRDTASKLAESDLKIRAWRRGAQVMLKTEFKLSDQSPVTRCEEEWGFPIGLNTLPGDDPMFQEYEWCPEFTQNIHSFIRDVGRLELKEEDHSGLIRALPVLLQAYSEVLSTKGDNETQQRRGVDTLLRYAFQRQGHNVKTEEFLCLRKSVSDISIWKAKADTLVLDLHDYPGFADKVEQRVFRDTESRLFWRAMVNIADRSVISFAVEHKKAAGEASANQLAYDLSTALSHRLALGMPEVMLYGATCDDGKFTLYETRWSYNEANAKQGIVLTPQKVWDVRIFKDFTSLYVFLRFIGSEFCRPIEEFNKAEIDLLTYIGEDWRATARGDNHGNDDNDNGTDADVDADSGQDNSDEYGRGGGSGGTASSPNSSFECNRSDLVHKFLNEQEQELYPAVDGGGSSSDASHNWEAPGRQNSEELMRDLDDLALIRDLGCGTETASLAISALREEGMEILPDTADRGAPAIFIRM